MRNPLSDKIVNIPPSGIRKFFDIVSEMKDAISLGWASRILKHPGIYGKKAFIPWKKGVPSIPPMQA